MKKKQKRTRATTVSYILKRAKDLHSLIYLTIRVNKRRLVWSTKESIDVKDWNQASRRPIQRTRRYDLAKLKERLDEYEATALQLHIDWNLTDREAAARCDHEDFKRELDYRTGWKDRPVAVKSDAKLDTSDFVAFAESLRDNRKNSPSIARGTWKVLNNHVNLLREYADLRHGGTIAFLDLDDVTLDKFKAYLFDRKDHKPQTVNKIMVSLRQVARRAAREGLMAYDETFRKWTSQEFKKRPQPALTKKELQMVIDLDLTAAPRLERVRDLFLLGVATAQRWSDYGTFTRANFAPMPDGGYRFAIAAQKKTKGKAEGPVMQFAWPILERYGYVGKRPFTPIKISSAKFNQYIKEVMALAMPNSSFTVYNDGRQLDDHGTVVPKASVIGTHAARRTAVGLLKSQGLTDSEVMAMTGHKSLSELEGYDQRDAETRAVDIMQKIRDNRHGPLRKVS